MPISELFGTLVLKQFLWALLHETERFVKSLSATVLKCISLLTNFSFHATQKTIDKRKGFEPKILKTLLSIVFCWPLAPLCQGAFEGVWGESQLPTLFGSFSQLEKEHNYALKPSLREIVLLNIYFPSFLFVSLSRQ